jgi:CRP/FNR family transcriptional regulator, anaerobic regulatory protein
MDRSPAARGHREHDVLDPTSAPGTDRGTAASGAPRLEPGRTRCGACALAPRCLPGTLGGSQLRRFEEAVQRCRPLGAGDHLFRVGDPFRSMFAVHSGCFKTYTVDAEGREHVMAFHFAGEIIGVDAIYPERHVSSCVALSEHSTVCVLPYPALTRLAQELPQLQTQMLRMLSRYVLGSTSIAGDFSAEERLAAFLVMVSARVGRRQPCNGDLDLAMSRQDIANFLRLAPETVSRILARFQKAGLVKADRKHIALLDPEGLSELAACMNPYTRYG